MNDKRDSKNEFDEKTVLLSSFPGTYNLALVAAVARNRIIGNEGGLPWHIPEDMRHFKNVTLGRAVIMGRKTFESMGKPLSDRTNIVISRDSTFEPKGAVMASSFEAALERAWQVDMEPRVIGGATIYALALPRLTRVFLTEIDRDVKGDTFFPETNWNDFEVVSRRVGTEPDVTFIEMVREPKAANA